jgi:hypothetical protein
MPSHGLTQRARPPFLRLNIGPFFKALLISILIELVVLLITGGAMFGSMMRHSGGAPRPALEDFLAVIGMLFHLISVLIAIQFGLFIFTPFIQIALMTCLLFLIFRARAARAARQPLSIKG